MCFLHLHDQQEVESCGHQQSELWSRITADLLGSSQIIEKISGFFFLSEKAHNSKN